MSLLADSGTMRILVDYLIEIEVTYALLVGNCFVEMFETLQLAEKIHPKSVVVSDHCLMATNAVVDTDPSLGSTALEHHFHSIFLHIDCHNRTVGAVEDEEGMSLLSHRSHQQTVPVPIRRVIADKGDFRGNNSECMAMMELTTCHSPYEHFYRHSKEEKLTLNLDIVFVDVE